MANLVELFDNIVQMQALNGVPLANGKLYVYALGRTRLMDTWSDVDGESLNTNPIILDDAGQAHVYVSDDFDYTLVVCDAYNNEVFSIDKYLYSRGEHSHADVAVAPSEHIGVSSYHVGETTVYVPYIQGELGKTYHGIEPIVVNNQENKISAHNIPLGVQEPLYFAEDSESACIIGLSGDTEPYVNHDRTIKIDNHVISTDMQSVMVRQQINNSSDEYKYAKICEADLNTVTWINEWMTTLQLNFQSCGAYYKGKSFGTFMLNCENYVQSSQSYVQKHEEDGKWVIFTKDDNSPQIVKLYLYWRDDSSSQHYELWGEFANLKYYEAVGVAAVLNCSLRNHLTSSLPIDQERNIWRFNPIGIETLKNALPTGMDLVGQYLPDDASIKPVSEGTFYATYINGGPDSGNTSFEDIKAAYDAGKSVYVNYKENADSKDTEVYSLVLFRDTPIGRPDLSCFFFSNLDRGTGKTIYRFPSNWGKMSEQNFANSNDLWHLSLAAAEHATNIVCPIPSGTYATYDYRFYKANQEITSTGTYAQWDDSQWDQVTIGEVLYNLEHTSEDSDIFWAEYDTTTHTEVSEAVNAGKQVICRVGTYLYLPLSHVTVVNDSPVFYFTGGEPEANNTNLVVMQCSLTVDGWGNSLQGYPVANNNWVTAYVDEQTSGFINSDAISAMATTGFVADVSGDITAMIPTALTGDYLTKDSADTLYQPLGDYVTTADLTGKQDILTFNYTDTDEISGINGSAIHSEGGGITGEYELSAGNGISINNDPIEQKTVISVSADYATNSDLQNVSGDITALIPSTAGLATTGDVADLAQSISETYQPIGNYLTADALDNVSANWNEVSAKLDTTAFSDVSGTFLTAHQDISNKLDTTAFSDVSGSFLTAVPDTYLQNTDLSTEDGKVTAISGIPLSAGGDVPEGVMVESGLEYNAVNEISGYNGSAIAQYGAEKQWLVHDDTLVHASNSAQYALGCNISALQRLMGIDETVLYSGDGTLTTAFTISEPLSSFERIRIYVHAASDGEIFEHIEEQAPPTGNYISYTHNYTIPNAYVCQCFLGYLANGLTFSNIVTRRNFWSPTGTGAYAVTSKEDQNLSANGFIYKVVGIGRKS